MSYTTKTNLVLVTFFVILPLAYSIVQGHLEHVEFDKATQIAAKHGVSKEVFREFVDYWDGSYPATEEAIKEAIKEAGIEERED
jgi:hypothetical protein